jgi:hypothetical protein
MARRRLPSALKAMLPLLVALGRDDAEVAALFPHHGITPKQVSGYRVRIALPNGRGWPITNDHLRRHLDDGCTDAEIAEKYGVGRRTVEVRRLEFLALRRDHDPRPLARRRVFAMPLPMAPEKTCIERAADVLGSRLIRTPSGAYVLDGRRVSVITVLKKSGVVP